MLPCWVAVVASEKGDPVKHPGRYGTLNRRQVLAASVSSLGSLALAPHRRTDRLSAAQGTQEATRITVWYFDDWVRVAADAFQKENSDIVVDLQVYGYFDVHTKLLTTLAAGIGAPDVCGIDLSYVGTFASQGGLIDLLQPPFDAGGFAADFPEYKWAHGSTEDGRLVLMPWDVTPAGLLYRADLLTDVGIDPEPAAMQARIRTWGDWFALGEEIMRRRPTMTLTSDAVEDVFLPMVEQHGEGWFAGEKVMIVENATAPLQTAVDINARGLALGIPSWSPEWIPAVQQNAFFGLACASWMELNLRRVAPQTIGAWRAIPAPEGDYSLGGSFLAIPEQSAHKEAAWEFVKFITASRTSALLGLDAGGVLPAYQPAWADPIFDQPAEFYGGQLAYRQWLEIAQRVSGRPIHPAQRLADDFVNTEVDNVVAAGKDPVQAMQDAEDEVLNRVPDAVA
jgi:multiple sugar transport system substrate-binding protein